ncbi:MAG: ribosome recycling factor [Zetaproteobacteria bacterium]|nr:ribosome recycling factor [Pseudobdellovibrionaceae bacterium]|tara:strand:- start:1501 stop:2055 length:555 start_codon:yes stop_codon:yes gene_type:complete
MDKILEDCKLSMEKALSSLDKELLKVRTGRASTTILEGIRVDYYGTPTPINQVASLSVPDARTIFITPFEKKLLSDIERAIQKADIGIQPNNDGNILRLPIPQLSEERRKEIAKSIKKIGEDSKVSLRKARQDSNNVVKKLNKDKEINEDDVKSFMKNIQDITDSYVKKVEEKVIKKEKEILTL